MKTPHELAEETMKMAEEFSRYSGLFAEMMKSRAEFYRKHRPNFKSDIAVEREWESTEQGVQMSTIKLKLKALEKQMSAHKTMLRLQENEARNIY